MIIEKWDDDQKKWVRKELTVAKPVIEEIDKMNTVEAVGLDYKEACFSVLDMITIIELDNFKPVRN